jgi:apolipoprotein N-acyltransferase
MKFSPYDFDYNLTPGTQFSVFNIKGKAKEKTYRFGVMICYESTIPAIARGFALDGNGAKKVDWLVNISNDGWFVKFSNGKVGPSTELQQHTIASIFRAVENRLSVLRSVNTGISCLIDPLGRIQDGYLAGDLPVRAFNRAGVEGYFADRVVIDSRVTVFSRYGQWLGKACRIIVLGILILLPSAWIVRNIKKRFIHK